MTQVQREDRPVLIRAGLVAAGVPTERVELSVALTDEIITTESGWQSDTCAWEPHHSYRGPAALFGADKTRVMTDGRIYATPRGLAQLTPWMFEQYHAPGRLYSTRASPPIIGRESWEVG